MQVLKDYDSFRNLCYHIHRSLHLQVSLDGGGKMRIAIISHTVFTRVQVDHLQCKDQSKKIALDLNMGQKLR